MYLLFQVSLASGINILKEVCYWTTSIVAIHFFYGSVIISREHLKRSIFQGQRVYFTTLVAAVLYNMIIIISGLWLIQENLKGMFI